MANHRKNDRMRILIFKEGATWYGAALELNIVESGDDPREVMLLLDEAIRGYIKAAQKAKLNYSILNQTIDPEYENLWAQAEAKVATPLKIYSTGSLMLSAI